MKSRMRLVLFFGVCMILFIFHASYAKKGSIVGEWQTIDEKTKQPNSVITIWRSKNKYFGRISKIYPIHGAKSSDICMQCRGIQHNKPMLGLIIIRNLVFFKQGKYVGGSILDPRDGKTYHCNLTVSSDNKTLKVRGYFGIPLFGQTKTWYRI